MRIHDFQPLIEKIRSAAAKGKILIATHKRPDGDAAGSAAALVFLLKENGYSASLFLPDEIPDSLLEFLPENTTNAARLPDAKAIEKSCAMVFSVDASTPRRVALGTIDPETLSLPFAAIDHHPDHVDFAPLTYVDSAAAAAAEIVYQLACAAQWRISAQAATCLLLGIISDTGCFRFDNTTPRALRTAAALLELGADRHRVIDRLYFSRAFNMASFEAELFTTGLKTAFGGRFAWFLISSALLKKYNVSLRNTENLIENLRSIDGVAVAAILKPDGPPGVFKVSLRSKTPSVSVGNIARKLNGGGHELAAGCTIHAQDAAGAEDILLKHVALELNP